jgi:hypothetical protein
MWIVFSATQGHSQTADFVGSMFLGFVGSLCSCWSAGSAFDSSELPLVLAVGAATWLVIAAPGPGLALVSMNQDCPADGRVGARRQP